ncbi:hypothetical protein ACPCKQ_04705 [Bacillus bombysepticus]|nr:hypothetical protein [Bacillus cereus]
MAVDWRTKRQVNKFVETLAISPVKSFYPTSVAKYDDTLSMELIFEHLLSLCESGELELLWEVKCPGYESPMCFRRIKLVTDYSEIIDKELLCDICGEYVKVEKSNIFPVFQINKEYREAMREEFKKKKSEKKSCVSEYRKQSQEIVELVSSDKPILSLGDLPPHIELNIQQLVICKDVGNLSNEGRSINRSFNGTSFGEKSNINIQADSNTNTINIGELLPKEKDIFADLRQEIEEMVKDEMDREQAMEFANQLEDAVQQNDADKSNKYIKWLERFLQNSSALVTIATAIQPLIS